MQTHTGSGWKKNPTQEEISREASWGFLRLLLKVVDLKEAEKFTYLEAALIKLNIQAMEANWGFSHTCT